MSDKHRPTYPTDPIPHHVPTPEELAEVAGECMDCLELRGSWYRNDGGEWEIRYMWWVACARRYCDHRHHDDDIVLALA